MPMFYIISGYGFRGENVSCMKSSCPLLKPYLVLAVATMFIIKCHYSEYTMQDVKVLWYLFLHLVQSVVQCVGMISIIWFVLNFVLHGLF